MTAIAYTPRPLTALSPDRLALYRWAEAHDWPRGVAISAWERIGAASATAIASALTGRNRGKRDGWRCWRR